MQELLAEHRRLTVLRHLERAARQTSNTSILTDVANGVGVPSTRDQINTALAWLEEQDLVTLNRSGEFVIATATRRGCEVATGHVVIPGVKRPSAGA
jgi:hypothetical protein